MKKILIFIAAMALTASCGKKGQQADNQQDYNEEKVEYILRDSTVYGFCGEGSAMNTLQLITDTGDTLTVNLERCRNKDRVMGGYAVGDEMAVMVNSDSTEALLVINKSVLHGDWVMPNPIDGSDEVGITIKEGGIVEGIEQGSIVYKTWRLVNGQLELVMMREGGSEMDETYLYDIKKLTPDSLVFQNADDIYEYGRQKPKEQYGTDIKLEEVEDFKM